MPRFYGMPCRTKAEATARYKQFLTSARLGEALGQEFFHAYPQALKIDVLWPYRSQTLNSIAKLENLETELRTIFDSLPHLEGVGLPAPTAGERHSHQEDPCAAVDLEDADLLRQLCDYYRSDFECFDYTMPAACMQ